MGYLTSSRGPSELRAEQALISSVKANTTTTGSTISVRVQAMNLKLCSIVVWSLYNKLLKMNNIGRMKKVAS